MQHAVLSPLPTPRLTPSPPPQSKPKTFLDLEVYAKRGVPDPGLYNITNSSPARGGKFNMSKPKSDVDWLILRASKIPAPGHYGVPDIRTGMLGARFSTARPKTSLDWEIARAKKTPGPGAYNVEGMLPNYGGKFGTGEAKSEIEWIETRASKLPGPAAYDLQRSMKYLSTSSPKFSFAGRPGPATMPAPFAHTHNLSGSHTRSASSLPGDMTGDMSFEGTGSTGMADSPERIAAGEAALLRTRASEDSFKDRLHKAYAKSTMIRKQKETIGFGRTFFM
ncbi:hypothetical protein T484DRAFT_1797028 [Baffinella frigidus]|nr:hypothetical protein T484DRAFT_1797028 [Cryptophyta sp. CCMP2293]